MRHVLLTTVLGLSIIGCSQKDQKNSPEGQSDTKQVITLGIGTQNTTTNTVTAGVIIKELGLLEKYLPRSGKYQNVEYKVNWQNFTSGPPVTNAMMANKLHIGMMGDYPLIINGYTFQSNPDSKSYLISLIAYNASGSGNGVVVHEDSPYYQLEDLKGKTLSVPFGSAAHGMLLKAMQDRGWPESYFKLSSQSPEVGTSNLQERKIDAHADFVPFAELLPFRGFARKIFDGAETGVPTFHGVVVRQDFADKYPEVVVAYLKAMLAADEWVKRNPKEAAEKIAQWTGTDKEVVYIFLGPGGIMTLDPSIKSKWIDTIRYDAQVLQRMNKIKDFNPDPWVNETYLRQAFKETSLDYEKQKASMAGTVVSGEDHFCNQPIDQALQAGEIWTADEGISAYSSPDCTLSAYKQMQVQGKKILVAYLFDQTRGTKLFADKAFYAISDGSGDKPRLTPFLLKKDAASYVAKHGGRVATFAEALSIAARRT